MRRKSSEDSGLTPRGASRAGSAGTKTPRAQAAAAPSAAPPPQATTAGPRAGLPRGLTIAIDKAQALTAAASSESAGAARTARGRDSPRGSSSGGGSTARATARKASSSSSSSSSKALPSGSGRSTPVSASDGRASPPPTTAAPPSAAPPPAGSTLAPRALPKGLAIATNKAQVLTARETSAAARTARGRDSPRGHAGTGGSSTARPQRRTLESRGASGTSAASAASAAAGASSAVVACSSNAPPPMASPRAAASPRCESARMEQDPTLQLLGRPAFLGAASANAATATHCCPAAAPTPALFHKSSATSRPARPGGFMTQLIAKAAAAAAAKATTSQEPSAGARGGLATSASTKAAASSLGASAAGAAAAHSGATADASSAQPLPPSLMAGPSFRTLPLGSPGRLNTRRLHLPEKAGAPPYDAQHGAHLAPPVQLCAHAAAPPRVSTGEPLEALLEKKDAAETRPSGRQEEQPSRHRLAPPAGMSLLFNCARSSFDVSSGDVRYVDASLRLLFRLAFASRPPPLLSAPSPPPHSPSPPHPLLLTLSSSPSPPTLSARCLLRRASSCAASPPTRR